MRKLASIQEVREVVKHENADMLEIVKINGWQCVVAKKDGFKQGDLGVYFEIDAFLPASDERYAFLEKQFRNFEGTQGARIKTIKLRGELSQGLMLPLSIYPEIQDVQIGDDVTELLGIIKYEKPLPVSEESKGFFPSFIEKTDQERVQNLPTLKRDGEWERTEKLDGTSLTVFLDNGDYFGVCSRNLELIETSTGAMWHAARTLELEKRLKRVGRNIALQGELVGPKIQGNRYQLKEQVYFIFDIYDIDLKRKLLPEERKGILAQLNETGQEIKEAPFLGYVTLPEGDDWMEQLLKEADGQSVLFNGTIREGDVYKHRTRNESFKVISNKYLLKWDE